MREEYGRGGEGGVGGVIEVGLRVCLNPPREHGNERNGTRLLVVIRSVPI